ncbi:unnamed protein product [Camellia sinensis]
MIRAVFYQVRMRVIQGMKDQGSKCDSIFKSIKDYSSSSKQARGFTGALDSNTATTIKAAAKSDKLKQAEESFRTVMFLSCWDLN